MLCVVTGLLVAAELLSCLKHTVSRTLFILASLHIHFATLVLMLCYMLPQTNSTIRCLKTQSHALLHGASNKLYYMVSQKNSPLYLC